MVGNEEDHFLLFSILKLAATEQGVRLCCSRVYLVRFLKNVHWKRINTANFSWSPNMWISPICVKSKILLGGFFNPFYRNVVTNLWIEVQGRKGATTVIQHDWIKQKNRFFWNRLYICKSGLHFSGINFSFLRASTQMKVVSWLFGVWTPVVLYNSDIAVC